MGIGEGKGERRFENAVRQAIASPLLETSINGAKAVIINVKGGFDLTLDEVSMAVNMVKEVISPDANTIFGATVDEKYNDRIIITIVATGFEGSKFENATNSTKQNFSPNMKNPLGGQNMNPNMGGMNNGMGGGFDKSNFNNFVNNNRSNSLFDSNFGNDAPTQTQNQNQARYESASMDLWSKLNSSDNQSQQNDRITNYDEATLDKKYGINYDSNRNMQSYSQNLYNQAKGNPSGMSQNPQQNNGGSGISSGIKVDDAEIPAFLKRKFNK